MYVSGGHLRLRMYLGLLNVWQQCTAGSSEGKSGSICPSFSSLSCLALNVHGEPFFHVVGRIYPMKVIRALIFVFLGIKSRLRDLIRSASTFQLRIIDSRPQISATFTQVTKPQPKSRVGEIAKSSCPCSARRSTVGISAASGIVSGPFSKSLVCPGRLTLLILLSSVCSLVP